MSTTFVPLSLTGRKASREIAAAHDLSPIRMPKFQLSPCRPAIRALAWASAAVYALGALASPAAADFRLCNNTGSRVGIAVGYKDPDGWITEGWWNLSARTCETLLRGALVARFYYIYAIDYDRGGEWSGQAFMCTREKEFTIRGTDNCLARGYDRTVFFEVDTSEQRAWTVQLTETSEQAPQRPLPSGNPLASPPGTRPAPGTPPSGSPRR
jgi:uncharacterized membrane protein